jgi:hypothetical protein
MKSTVVVVLAAFSLTACTSARFAPLPPQVQATPQQPHAGQQKDLGGPYTREREDREFGGRP